MIRLTLAIALLGSMAILPATAFAMEPYLPKSPKSFSKADVDTNGKITAAELTPRVERRFDRLDADKSGAVSVAELDEALQKSLERRKARIMADLDANKDGQVTRAELDAAVDRLIAAADLDHDGGVTFDEAQKYRVAKLQKPATAKGGTPN